MAELFTERDFVSSDSVLEVRDGGLLLDGKQILATHSQVTLRAMLGSLNSWLYQSLKAQRKASEARDFLIRGLTLIVPGSEVDTTDDGDPWHVAVWVVVADGTEREKAINFAELLGWSVDADNLFGKSGAPISGCAFFSKPKVRG